MKAIKVVKSYGALGDEETTIDLNVNVDEFLLIYQSMMTERNSDHIMRGNDWETVQQLSHMIRLFGRVLDDIA